MQQAGTLVEQIQAPIGGLVEDFGSKRVVYGKLSAREEILVLLHSHYPTSVALKAILESLDRRNAVAVKKAIRELWIVKHIEGSSTTEYHLTAPGLREAGNVISKAIV
jgi:hypothetical protein